MLQPRVLIVEDEAIVAEDLSHKVTALGYQVVGLVPSGEQALSVAKKSAIDLVLMDLQLTGNLHGVQTAQQLQELCDPAIVFITAHSDPETVNEANATNPLGYILKPFGERDLAVQIAIALQKHRTDRALRKTEQALRDSEAWQSGQKEAFQAAMKGAPLQASLEPLVRTAVQHFDGQARAAFYLANQDATTLSHLVGMSDAYARCVDGFKIGADSLACGLAMHKGEPVITPDVTCDPLWQSWLWMAQEHNYRSCWSFPVRTTNGPLLGTLALYFAEPRQPTPRDYELAGILTHAATIIISRHKEVAERARVEQALSETEERLRSFLDNSAVIAWMKDEAGRHVFLSDNYVKRFGMQLLNWIGKTDFDLWPHEVAENFRLNDLAVLSASQPIEIIEEARTRDGAHSWWLNSKFSYQDANGKRYVGGLGVDITDRKHAEDALRTSEGKYRYVFETVGASIFEEDWTDIRKLLDELRAKGVTDLRTYLNAHPEVVAHAISLVKITDVNDFTLQVFRAPSKDALLGALDRIFVPETTEVFKEELIAVWEGRNIYRGHAPMQTMEGDKLSVLFTLVAPKQDMEWKRVMVTMTDVTALHQVEAKLRQSQERLLSFADKLEHLVEERTQELVQSQERLRAMAKELNLAEHRERKRLSAELHDHLQQSLVFGKLKLAQGKRVIQSNPHFEKLIEETDAIFSDALKYTRTLVAELSPPALRDHGLVGGLKWLAEYMKKHEMMVTVSTEDITSPNLPEDQGVLLFQCVRELLINSAKHAGTQEASVNMEQCGGQLIIEVRDNGAGFDVVAATEADATDSPPGGVSSKFGLLSIRERMRAVGGSFDIQSLPGKGTRATLLLPLANAAAAWSGAEPTLTPVKKSQPGEVVILGDQNSALSKNVKVRLLLVDDHAMVRQGLRAVLESYDDLEIAGEASDGQEAIIATERLHPHVVIMDINMPNMNGIEATSRIKAQYPHVRVIGLSVNADHGNQDKMRAAGASHLLTKEAAVEHLYNTITGAPTYVGQSQEPIVVGEELPGCSHSSMT